MARASRAVVIARFAEERSGTIRLDDGRELPFDAAAFDPTDAPEKGDAVRVTVRPSATGDRVVKLGRVRAPRPSLDEALVVGARVPVGRDDLLQPLAQASVGALRFTGGVGFGDVLGGDGIKSIADAGDVSGDVVEILQDGELAFLRIDFAPFIPGRVWSRRQSFPSRTRSFVILPLTGRDAIAQRVKDGGEALLGDARARIVEVEKAACLLVRAPAETAIVRVASDAAEKPTTVVIDLRVCETK